MSTKNTMKALVTFERGKYRLEDVAIPSPGGGEVLVKVSVVAQNPSDWKTLGNSSEGNIIGADFSGIISEIGPDVDKGLRYIGERVSGLVHGGRARNGAFAEYVVAQAELLVRLPGDVSFEDAAQMGVACMTACLSLYYILDIPTPDDPPTTTAAQDILVWSGATTSGQYVIQLAKQANLRVITTASPKQYDFVKSLGADSVYDYSDSFAAREIFEATRGRLTRAVDCWSEGMSPYQVSTSLSAEGGKIATLLPYLSREKGVDTELVVTYAIFGKDIEFPFKVAANMDLARCAHKYSRLISRLLFEGKIRLGPVRIFPNGLLGVVDGMEYSRLGKVHGEKIVYRISDTPGIAVA